MTISFNDYGINHAIITYKFMRYFSEKVFVDNSELTRWNPFRNSV